MTFPIEIKNEKQLRNLISEITRQAAKDTVEEMIFKTGLVRPYLLKKECEDLSSYQKIKNAIEAKELVFIIKGRNWIILRTHFYSWLQNDSLL